MTIQRRSLRTSSRSTLIFAALVLAALVATACGSSATLSTADEDLLTVDVEYGATVEEWETAAEESDAANATADVSSGPPKDSPYTSVEWEDLVPEGMSVDEVWDKYEDQLAELEYGTPEEEALYQKVLAEIDPDVIEPALDGQQIRMTGFVAPLTYDGDIVTEFLLVPYFGACIHVPPPPSNQTVLVKVDKDSGFTSDDVYGVVWVEGTLAIESATTDLATASYAITDASSGVSDEY